MGTDDHMETATRTEISVKVTHAGVAKRATFKVAELTYDALCDWVNASFAFPSPVLVSPAASSAAPGGPISRLVYRDPEGDAVSISSTEELKEALRLLAADAEVLALHLSFPRPRERWHRHMMAHHGGFAAGEAGEPASAEFLPFTRPGRFGCPPPAHHAHPASMDAPSAAESTNSPTAAPTEDGNAGPAHCPFMARGGFGGRCGRGGFGGFGARPHHPMMDPEAWEERREACQARREARRAARAAAFAAAASPDAPNAEGADASTEELGPDAHCHFGGRGFGFGGRGGHHGFGRFGHPHGPHHGHGHHAHPHGHQGPHGFGFGGRGGRFAHGGPHSFGQGHPHHQGAPAHFFGHEAMPATHPHPGMSANGPCAPMSMYPEAHSYPHVAAHPAPHHGPGHHARERHGREHVFSFFDGREYFGGAPGACNEREQSDRRLLRLLSFITILSFVSVALHVYGIRSFSVVLMAIAGAIAFFARRRQRKAMKHSRRAAKRAAHHAHRQQHAAQNASTTASPAPAAPADEKDETSTSAPCGRPTGQDASPSTFDFFFGRRHRHHPHGRRCARNTSSGEEADIDTTDSSPSPAPTSTGAPAATSAATEPKCRRGMRHGFGGRCRFAERVEEPSAPSASEAAPTASSSVHVAPAAPQAAAPSYAFIEPTPAAFMEHGADDFAAHFGHPAHPHNAGFGPFGGPFRHPHHPHHRHHHRFHGRFDGEESESFSGSEEKVEKMNKADKMEFRSGLKTLQDMGFTDLHKNRKLLKRLGSLSAVISALTGASTSGSNATSSVSDDDQKA